MSLNTTNLGPRVSLTTVPSDPNTPPYLFLDSNTTLEADGQVNVDGEWQTGSASTGTFSGVVTIGGEPTINASRLTISGVLASTATLDASSGQFLSRQTTASLDSTNLADGEFAVADVSATSSVLYFRSGVTTYQFWADDASLL